VDQGEPKYMWTWELQQPQATVKNKWSELIKNEAIRNFDNENDP